MSYYVTYMEKAGLFPGLAGGANTLVSMSQIPQAIGAGIKWLGRNNPGGKLHAAGESFEHAGTQLNTHINNGLNAGPGLHYNPSGWHPAGKFLASNIGMNVESTAQKLTPQRALVWAGGAMALHETANSLSNLGGGGAARQGNHFMPEGYQSQAKEAAVKQAREDFNSLMEETL